MVLSSGCCGPGPPRSVWRGRQHSSRSNVVPAGAALEAGVGAAWKGWCGAAWTLVRRLLEAGVAPPGGCCGACCCPAPCWGFLSASLLPTSGAAGRGSTQLHLLARRLCSSGKLAVQLPRPLLPGSPYSPRGSAGLSPQAAHPAPGSCHRLSLSAEGGGDGATSRHRAASAPPAAGGAEEKDARKQNGPAGRRVAPGLRPLVPAPWQRPGPSLPCCSPESSKALGPAGRDTFFLTEAKPSIVLTPQFLSRGQGQLTKEQLQQHVKSVPSPMRVLRKPRPTMRNPGSSGRKEPPRSGDRDLVGKTRNQEAKNLDIPALRQEKQRHCTFRMPKHTTSHANNMRQAISFPPDYLYPWHGFLGVLWMLLTIVFLGVSTVGLFLRKITFCRCAQALERETAESKAAYKRHRWRMRKKKRVPGRHMSEEPAQKRLCLKNAFWRGGSSREGSRLVSAAGPTRSASPFGDSGPHSVPMRNSSCVPSEITEKTKVNMAAAQRHHCSALPCSPYLMADPSGPLMACPPPPPFGCRLGAPPFPSAKGVLGPLTTPQLQCPLGPLPASSDDEFSRSQTPTPACLLAALPPSSANDFLSLYTIPPECLCTPLPASSDDEFSRPQTPTPECLLAALPPSSANDFLGLYTIPPECLCTPLPASSDDEFSRPQTPTPECLLAALPPSSANDFLGLYTIPPECLCTPLPASSDDEFSRPQTPTPECLLAALPPSSANDFLSLYTTPLKCLQTPLPLSTDDDL
uniref:uncharacterized protein LOC108590490 n=1 Tax=Callithrix jacchus TaxID=9483 RepID=UPI0023DD1349|nr:uncharacterized protein LOC108590490 [Callithrix jacchus]